jgi:cell division protein FtsB
MNERQKLFLFAGLPAVALVGALGVAVLGDGGLWRYRELQAEADRVQSEWAGIERENTVLLHRLQQLGQDPIHLERMAAEQLRMARPGAVLYTFDDAGMAGMAGAAGGSPVGAAVPVQGVVPDGAAAGETAP